MQFIVELNLQLRPSKLNSTQNRDPNRNRNWSWNRNRNRSASTFLVVISEIRNVNWMPQENALNCLSADLAGNGKAWPAPRPLHVCMCVHMWVWVNMFWNWVSDDLQRLHEPTTTTTLIRPTSALTWSSSSAAATTTTTTAFRWVPFGKRSRKAAFKVA